MNFNSTFHYGRTIHFTVDIVRKTLAKLVHFLFRLATQQWGLHAYLLISLVGLRDFLRPSISTLSSTAWTLAQQNVHNLNVVVSSVVAWGLVFCVPPPRTLLSKGWVLAAHSLLSPRGVCPLSGRVHSVHVWEDSLIFFFPSVTASSFFV